MFGQKVELRHITVRRSAGI